MARRRELYLTGRQLEELTQGRDHDPHPYVRERCAAVLKMGQGDSPHFVARTGLLKRRKPDTLYRWLNGYEQAGFQGLVSNQQGGARRGGL